MSSFSDEQRDMRAWDMINRREEQEERWTQQQSHESSSGKDEADDIVYGIHTLDSKYYQKLGEVWDHETKDFKVLYKPLYCCSSKKGSFEAHHLAVSTFERWERKFTPFRVCHLEDLPEDVRRHVVTTPTVAALSAGNSALPLTSVPMPPPMQKGSPHVSVIINENPEQVAMLDQTMCRSDSGYGRRSLIPYFVMEFSPEFEESISKGRKTATTRVLQGGVEGGEPHLHQLVAALAVHQSAGVVVKAVVCDDHDSNPPRAFARLRVLSVQEVAFASLTEELAAIEQFPTLNDFNTCLKGFYPWIEDNDTVFVFHFELVAVE